MSDSLHEVIESSTRGGFFLVFGNVFANLILAVGLIVIPRLLGSDHYGLYTLSFLLPNLLMLFADYGVNAGIIRFSASFRALGQEKRASEIIKHALLFKATISLIVFALSFTFANYFATNLLKRPEAEVYIKLASLSLPFQVFFDAVNSALIGLERMSSVALINVLGATVRVAASIGLVLIGYSVVGAITGQVASALFVSVLGSLILFLKYHRKLGKTDNDTTTFEGAFKNLVTYGFPLFVSALLLGFVPQYQGIILAQFTSNEEIGNFRGAVNLLTLLAMITLPITTTLFPAFSKLDPKGEDVKKFFRLSVKYTTLLIVPATLLVLLFFREIVYIAYGSSFTSAPLYLLIYCTSYLLVGLGSLVLGVFFNGTGETWITFKMSLISLIFILPLTPLLTAFYGVVGLIVAQLVASFFGALYGLNVVKFRFHIKLYPKTLLKIYATSAVAALPVAIFLNTSVFWWVWNMILGTAMYSFIWLTLIPLTGTLRASELQNMEIMLQKLPFLKEILKPVISYERKLADKTLTKKASKSQTSHAS